MKSGTTQCNNIVKQIFYCQVPHGTKIQLIEEISVSQQFGKQSK